VRRNVRSNGNDTPNPSLSRSLSHLPSGDWIERIIIYISGGGQEGRLPVMPFPNEDNYFQESESGQSSRAGRRQEAGGRAGWCIEIPQPPYDKKRIENRP
jgi:hypothetical protein